MRQACPYGACRHDGDARCFVTQVTLDTVEVVLALKADEPLGDDSERREDLAQEVADAATAGAAAEGGVPWWMGSLWGTLLQARRILSVLFLCIRRFASVTARLVSYTS